MARQLSFDLPMRTALGRDDFFVSPANADAVAMIESWRDWPTGALVLTGPTGSGKTHLAHVWAASTNAKILAATDLVKADLAALAANPTVIEDAHLVYRTPGAEAGLLHLFNLLRSEGQPMLVTGSGRPLLWAPNLADLSSRLQALPTARLYAPDDRLLAAVLTKLFADRQVFPSPDLPGYLARQIEPSFEAASQIVARIDEEALATGRAVNRALAARVLDKVRN